jgi:hypothetical protein
MHADMQMRRPFRLLLIVVPTALLILLLVDPWKLLERNNSEVRLKNSEEVDRVLLIDSYHSTELIRTGGSWYLFGSEEVSPTAVENLLIAASRLEVSSIVGRKVFEESGDSPEETRELTFLRGQRQELSYRLKTVSGKYLLCPEGSEQAYYVALPGYPGLDLDRIFSSNPDHYRDHLLIDLRPSDISSIEIHLASGEAFRFYQDTEGNISCVPANENTIIPEVKPGELPTKLLFSYFTSIRFEQKAGIPADSLLSSENPSQQMASIQVEAVTGEHYSLKVFPFHENPNSEAHLFRALVLYNDEQEALFISYIYLDVLMRGLSHYFGEK